MDSKKINEALGIYKKYFEKQRVPVMRHPNDIWALSIEDTLAHCHWMVITAQEFLKQDRREKAMRWLCFVQGCLFSFGRFSIDEMKDHNRPDELTA